jgi:hypothetical protein
MGGNWAVDSQHQTGVEEAGYCAQKANIPSKGWFFVCSVCHSLRKYMFIKLFAFVLFRRLKINHMSGYDYALISGPVHMVHSYVPEFIYCVKFWSQFFTVIFSYVRGVLTHTVNGAGNCCC